MYSKNDQYTFYMRFKANDDDEWWNVASSTTYGSCCVAENSSVTNVVHTTCCLPDTTDLSSPDGTECDSATQTVADTTAEIKNFRVMF